MAEEALNTNINNPEGAGASGAGERTFTQAQLDAIVAREKAKATKGWFSADDMAAKDDSINTLTTERDEAKNSLTAAQAEIENLKRERVLVNKGVPADDIEYYAFKIGKLVTDKKTFEQAADEFLKDYTPKTAKFSTGGSVQGGATGDKPNDAMNALIRGIKK